MEVFTMCSIMGYCGLDFDLAMFEEGFSRTKSRGPDDSRIINTGDGLLGFHRLAIMGLTPLGMQPFHLDGSYVVCNGEIYGFEQLKKELEPKYTFQSDSDCEILLPLYKEYGVDMFAKLDAEFACIIYDGEAKEYIAARGPHWHPPAVLRIRLQWGHLICQRSKEPSWSDRSDFPLSSRSLLQRRTVHLLPGYCQGRSDLS